MRLVDINTAGGSGGGDEDGGGSAGAGFAADDDFDVAIQGVEEMHETLGGKTLEAIIHERGNLWLIDAQDARRRGLRQLAGPADVVDGHGEADFGLFFLGAGQTQVGKNIARASDDSNLISTSCHSGRQKKKQGAWLKPGAT
jgi:hypothetical protein